MPCWYYEKKELKNTPSALDNIDPEVEARYRREGARFIIDAGTKMGLRHDTCATGVVYFHRFYMFHSFQEFHRFATGACCLFLAGKVEETPKKCKDIIKTCQTLLTPQQLAAFGEDPKEEVMTLERILLQTIKFDLQIDHPYHLLLKYAKILKGDKEKIQKMVQMAWTFVNDSMCTMLSLQWEPEIISVSLMYLASRLSKTDIQDWHGKQPGTKIKWYEHFVEGISMELMEDVCHQVLDLYSKLAAQKKSDSPPPPSRDSTSSSSGAGKRRATQVSPSATRGKVARTESTDVVPPPPDSASRRPVKPAEAVPVVTTQPPPAQPYLTSIADSNYTQYNPYVSSQMYSSSFMSQEGNQSIQNLLNPGEVQPAYASYPPTSTQYANPPSASYQQPPYAHPQAYATAPPQVYQAPPPAMAYPPGTYPPATTAYQAVLPGAPPYSDGYQIEPSAIPAPAYPGAPGFNPQQQPPPTFPGPTDTQMLRPPGTGIPTPAKGIQPKVKPNKSTGLATVRISSRQVRR